MGKAKIEMVIRFLKDMQIEKVCVFGEEDEKSVSFWFEQLYLMKRKLSEY